MQTALIPTTPRLTEPRLYFAYPCRMSTPGRLSLFELCPRHAYLPGIVLLSLGLNIAALLTPFLVMKKLIFFEEAYTLLHSIGKMWEGGHYLLAAVIFAFSVVFPFLKLATLLWVWFIPMAHPTRHRTLWLVGVLGKWSMLDVFIVALLILLSTSRAVFDAQPRIGVYLFTAAIVLSLVASVLIERLAKRVAEPPANHVAPRG